MINAITSPLSFGIYFPLLGYLAGSIPFSLLISRLLTGTDIREGGSGHATTTNNIRQMGWIPGVIVLFLDISKGYLPIYFAVRMELP